MPRCGFARRRNRDTPERSTIWVCCCRRASVAGVANDALEFNLEAYKWFRLAAAQGYQSSETEFEYVALGMTREQVAEVNHRMAEFAVSHPAPGEPNGQRP